MIANHANRRPRAGHHNPRSAPFAADRSEPLLGQVEDQRPGDSIRTLIQSQHAVARFQRFAATGLLLEAACSLVEIALAKAMNATPHLDVEAAAHAIKRLNACGVTGMQEALTTRAVLRAVKALEDQGRYAQLSVQNKGPVLPAEMRGRLFESMVSVREPASGAAPHLGLGLYVARLIAEFHGGAIEAADTPARDGVVVRVHLPRAR